MPPENPHESVRALEGPWTIRGMEESFTDVCELFPGGHHLVCCATSRNGETWVTDSEVPGGGYPHWIPPVFASGGR